MHYNKQCDDLIKSKINDRFSSNYIPSGENKLNIGNKSQSSGENIKNRNSVVKQNNTSNIGIQSCTSSTDSGVNVSDNDEISPSPTSSQLHLLLLPNSSPSRVTATTANSFNKKFQQNNENTSQDNNIENNNNNKGNNYNTDNDKHYVGDHDDELVGSDKELKGERQQQFFKVENSSSNEGNNGLYQPNAIESTNVININNQRDLASPISTAASPETDKKRSLSQHNECRINPPQRPASATSSVSSIASSSDSNLPSKMHNHCSESPVVSIRSINSSIITSDSESDSEVSGDTEGGHKDYVIKKLGTQVTYPPKHPDIPNINSGHTVLNQKIIPNANQEALTSLATLAAVGDRIGAAQALGPVPSYSAAAQRPQIGSIALSNSSDVTFGDKHFYEGPVTIQQFLIDSRDKFREVNGKENPTYANDKAETSSNAKDINSSEEQPNKLYAYISKRRKLFIPAFLALIAILIVAIVLGSNALNDSKSKIVLGNSEESRSSIPFKSTIAKVNVGGGRVLRIVPRVGWLAQPPLNPWVPLDHPVKRVIVIPTRTSECETQAACTYTVRITQTFNIESQQQDDIIYNFLVGGDGNIYEGRGWDNRGSVLKGFNDDSITLAYIGSFKKQPPSYKQLNVTKLLLEEGVRLQKLSPNYIIVGANKLDPTSVTTIADALYKSFENWPHWSEK